LKKRFRLPEPEPFFERDELGLLKKLFSNTNFTPHLFQILLSQLQTQEEKEPWEIIRQLNKSISS
ncbi:MAG: hypothetical protein D6769_02210, partial [Methanobacteriota archaeon]